MSWGISPWVYPVWNSLGFLDLGGYFLPHFREVFSYCLPSNFLWPFFLSSSSGTPMVRMLGHFTLSQRSLRLSSFLLILFSSLLHLFPPFYLLPHILSSVSIILLLAPSRVFLISFIALFIFNRLIFISSRSLLNISCIFSILSPGYLSVTPFCFQDFGSFLLSLF